MKVKIVLLILATVFLLSVNNALSQTEIKQNSHRDIEPQLITLFSQNKHNKNSDYGKTYFNFKLGVRGDSTSPRTLGNYDLKYGGIINNDKDWFCVPTGNRSYSQIKDIGTLNWKDVYDIPLLYASPVPHQEGKTYIFEKDGAIKILPENSQIKIIEGHMYLLHAKDVNDKKEINKDLYVMFRLEALKSGDEVTISWKLVPSPENQ